MSVPPVIPIFNPCIRVKSGKFWHQVNSDTHLQAVEIKMRRLLMSRLIRISIVCSVNLFFIPIIELWNKQGGCPNLAVCPNIPDFTLGERNRGKHLPQPLIHFSLGRVHSPSLLHISANNRGYSKTCVKRPLSKRPTFFFKTNYCLMLAINIAECSKGSIMLYFRPSFSYHLPL